MQRSKSYVLAGAVALAVGGLVAASVAAPSRAHAQFRMEDSLRGSTSGGQYGGTIGADGWTVTERTDRVVYRLPRLVRGSVEFTVTNITMATLTLSDHEIFNMYEGGYGMADPIPYNPEMRENHYKCMLRIYGELDGPTRHGFQKLMFGLCPSGAPGYGACACSTGEYFREDYGGDAAWDGSPQRIRIEWGDGHARYLRNGGVVHDFDYTDTGLTFGPSELFVSLGGPRPRDVGSAGMPIGAVFTDVVIEGTEGGLSTCEGVEPFDAGPPPEPDAGPPEEVDAGEPVVEVDAGGPVAGVDGGVMPRMDGGALARTDSGGVGPGRDAGGSGSMEASCGCEAPGAVSARAAGPFAFALALGLVVAARRRRNR